MIFRPLVGEGKGVASVGIGIADIMPARSLLIAVASTIEIHADAEHIVLMKELVDAERCVPLEPARILESGVVE